MWRSNDVQSKDPQYMARFLPENYLDCCETTNSYLFGNSTSTVYTTCDTRGLNSCLNMLMKSSWLPTWLQKYIAARALGSLSSSSGLSKLSCAVEFYACDGGEFGAWFVKFSEENFSYTWRCF